MAPRIKPAITRPELAKMSIDNLPSESILVPVASTVVGVGKNLGST